jgi:hypothetical protein
LETIRWQINKVVDNKCVLKMGVDNTVVKNRVVENKALYNKVVYNKVVE